MYYSVQNLITEMNEGRFNNIDSAWRYAFNHARMDGNQVITVAFSANEITIKDVAGVAIYVAKLIPTRSVGRPATRPTTGPLTAIFKFRGTPNNAGWFRTGNTELDVAAFSQQVSSPGNQHYYLVGMGHDNQPTQHAEIPNVIQEARKRIAKMPGKRNVSVSLSDVAVDLAPPMFAAKLDSTAAWFVLGFIDGTWIMAGKRYA